MQKGAIYYQQVLICLLFFRPEFLSPPESDKTNITKKAGGQKGSKTKKKKVSKTKQGCLFLPPTLYHLKLFLKSFFLRHSSTIMIISMGKTMEG